MYHHDSHCKRVKSLCYPSVWQLFDVVNIQLVAFSKECLTWMLRTTVLLLPRIPTYTNNWPSCKQRRRSTYMHSTSLPMILIGSLLFCNTYHDATFIPFLSIRQTLFRAEMQLHSTCTILETNQNRHHLSYILGAAPLLGKSISGASGGTVGTEDEVREVLCYDGRCILGWKLLFNWREASSWWCVSRNKRHARRRTLPMIWNNTRPSILTTRPRCQQPKIDDEKGLLFTFQQCWLILAIILSYAVIDRWDHSLL